MSHSFCGLFAAECDPLEAFEFADRLLDARPCLIQRFREEAGLFMAFDLVGMTGQMPRLAGRRRDWLWHRTLYR